MNLSPFTVYLILQADAIGGAVMALIIILMMLMLLRKVVPLFGRAQAIGEKDEKYWDDVMTRSPSWLSVSATVVVGCLTIGVTPSTKTLAASFIAPAIVNSSVIQKDLPELYTLGVEALKRSFSPQQ